MKYISFLLGAVIMIGCGGGGDTENTTAPPVTQVVTDPTGPSMNNLTVDSSFDFTTDVTVTITVSPQLVSQRAYLNVCQAGAKVISDDTCYLRSPLSSDGLTRDIVIPHKEQNLKADIWYYNVNTEPMTFTWQYQTSSERQIFSISK